MIFKNKSLTLSESATHIKKSESYCKNAFTLAEVLITLGIIGVVAAMTIPTLMINYRKTAWATTLKKDYSTVVTACERMLAEENVNRLSETKFYRNSYDENDVRQYLKIKEYSGENTYVMPDSSSIHFGVGNRFFAVCVDVNGENKQPNESGKDLFCFDLDQHCNWVRPDENDDSENNQFKAFAQVYDNNWIIP